MEEDLILKNRSLSSGLIADTHDFKKEGLVLVSVSQEDVEYLGKKFNEIFTKNNSSRNGLSMLNGALYALGAKQKNNPEWREHCAGSLRELIHECRGVGQISSWFCGTFKQKNSTFPNSLTNSEDYAKINGFYDYFSEIHHHNSLHIIQRLQFLYGDHVKVGEDSEQMFVKAVRDFIQFMLTFFRKHVK